MGIYDKMTALASEVRRLSNTTALLSVDGMVEKMSALSGLTEREFNDKFKQILERTVTEITAEDLAGITKIGNRAFMNCDYLTKVTLPDTITSLGGSAFNSCDRLVEVNLPASIDMIEADAFYECVALEELAMPDNVSWVGAYALGACRNLKRVMWTARGCGLVNGCLSGCTSLEYIDFSKCIKVANLDAVSVLNGVPTTCKFYVPISLYMDWISATNWSNFKEQIVPTDGISFYFNDYYVAYGPFWCPEGMTWGEFIDSDYYSQMSDSGHGVRIELNETVWLNINNMGYEPLVCNSHGTDVKADTPIENEQLYYWNT